MADDLQDEWWKESNDDDDSAGEDGGEEKIPKRAAKRPAESDEEAGSSDEPCQKAPSAKKSKPAVATRKSGKKKKKTQKKFARKKITEVDEDTLKKGGTPEDVQALLRPMIAISKRENCPSESDDNDDEEEEEEAKLSNEADFFPTNQQWSADKYLREVLPGWQVAMEKAKLSPGSPLLLVLCSSAIRCVQLNRELKSFLGKDCKTAKLFSKHIKLEEQKTFLKKKVCHASIGTPNRIQTLLESGALKLTQLHALVLDWNWRDVKLKRMVDIPDIRRDLSVLLKEHVLEHIKHTPCRIGIL